MGHRMEPLHFGHRIVLVVNLATGHSSACFVPNIELAQAAKAGAEVGSDVAFSGSDSPVMVLLCPEDLIQMRESTPPPDLIGTHRDTIRKVDALLASQIEIAMPVMIARSPS